MPRPSVRASTAAPPPARLPCVCVPLTPQEISRALETAARRGRLPGLRPGSTTGSFELRDFGVPFESQLLASATPAGGMTRIEFQTRLRPVIPAIFAAVLVLSIWPGIYLVDSMLNHYFTGYNIPTWWWYLPLTVPTSPWAFWSAVKKSRLSAQKEANDIIQKLAAELKGDLCTDPPP